MKKKVVLATLVFIVLVTVAVIAFTVGKNSDSKPSFLEDTTVETVKVETTEEITTEEKVTEETCTEESTTKELLPVQKNWSAWLDKLPDYVNKKDYEVDERTLYKSKTLEKKSSTNKNAYKASDGWDCYDVVEGKGNYGNWSSWSTDYVAASDTRDVEMKQQYSYRQKNTDTQYSPWSSWSEWSNTLITADNLRRVETRTVYPYYYFYCYTCGRDARFPYHNITCEVCGKTKIKSDSGTIEWFTNPWSDSIAWGTGTGKNYQYINGGIWWNWTDGSSKTQYRYSTRTIINNSDSFSAWSAFSDEPVEVTENREVRTRTVYRYRDREENIVYYFKRWGEWSDWSTTAVYASDEVKVGTKIQYRFKSR